MTATTASLTDFLLQRIAEDEADARHRDVVTFGAEQRALAGAQGTFDPARVLAECEAKRRIVEDVEEQRDFTYATDWDLKQTAKFLDLILHNLAAVYADHPDFRDEWRQ